MPISLEEKYKSVLRTIELYPSQLKQAWEEIGEMSLPPEYEKVDNVVVCGMGGSALGARVVDSLIVGRIRLPIEIFTEYHIPNYVDEKTLVILSSYSGTTEEVLYCADEAFTKGAKIFVIATGGTLAGFASTHALPAYIFNPRNNPSEQPRMAIGYAAGSILALINKLSFIYFSLEEVLEIVEVMNKTYKEFSPDVEKNKNLAKHFSQELENKAPVLISSEHLNGVIHTIKNQFNESAKTFSVSFDLPELNHHLMEGLGNPELLKTNLKFIFFDSKIYSDRVYKRYNLTKKVIEKNGYSLLVYEPRSGKKVEQVFETLVFGSMVVYYLSQIYKIDPTIIPWVDYFKKELAKG